MRISDWSSDVCSSDLEQKALRLEQERVQKQQVYLGAAKSALEERQFDELLKAAERDATKHARAQVAAVNSETLIARTEKANTHVIKTVEEQTDADRKSLASAKLQSVR